MYKKFFDKVIAIILICSILIYTIPIYAYTNEETVYSKMDSSGSRYKTIVTTIEEDKNGTKTTQKDNKDELPIDCEITYELDGKEMTADKIAGKSGKATIKIKYINKDENEFLINNKNEILYTPFLIISGVILDNENCKNVEITNGKLINNGNNTVAIGFAMPGLKESLQLNDIEIPDTIEISFETDNFELGNIITYATPNLLGDLDITLSDFSEIFNQVEELNSASIQIEEGSIALNDGIVVLSEGAVTLDNGAKELVTGIDTLKNGVNELNSGANTLKDGTSLYTSKSQEFSAYMGELSNGASTLNSSYTELDAGIQNLNNKSSELKIGAQNLYGALATISPKLKEAESGIDQIIELLSGINQSIDSSILPEIDSFLAKQYNIDVTIDNQETVSNLENIISKNNEELEKLIDSNNELIAIKDTIEDETTKNSLQNVIDTNIVSINSLKSENEKLSSEKDSLTNKTVTVNASSEYQKDLNTLKTQLSSLNSSETSYSIKMALNGVKQIKGNSQEGSGINYLNAVFGSLVDGSEILYNGTETLLAGTNTLSSGSTQVLAGLNSLNNSTLSLASASNELASSSFTISSGASSLQSGTIALLNGTNALVNGSQSLKEGTSELVDGTNQLIQGSNQLVDGIKQFNEEGISKIYDMVNGEIKDTIKRFEKLEDISNGYNTYSSDKARDEIKFINVVDSIKASDKKDKDSK